jgi:acyl carrier protein
MASEIEIRTKLKEFISNNFLLGKGASELKDEASFLDTGIVDSTGVLEIVEFLQDTWSISVSDEELLPENLDSVNNLTQFVIKKIGQ